MIVVVEGLPGAGKTTAINRLGQRLGAAVVPEVMTTEPIDGDLQFYINNDISKLARAAVSPQTVVLIDRDFTSTLAYRYATQQCSGGVIFDEAKIAINMELRAGALFYPDLYLYFDIDLEMSLSRQNPTNAPNWQNVFFLSAARKFYGEYFATMSAVEYIDASRPATEVQQHIEFLIKRHQAAVRHSEQKYSSNILA